MTKLLGGLQIIALTVQGSSEFIAMIPAKWHPVMHTAISVIQALGWWMQRGYDPNGIRTPGDVTK